MPKTKPFDEHTDLYEEWFDKYHYAFQSEVFAIRSQMQELPENIRALEVGVGTGRFAKDLGIKEGVEPAEKMRERAIGRGIEVMNGTAEHLPYRDLQFDLVLYVTVCNLDSIQKALKETKRVLKNDGSIIIGFIDRNSILGQKYEAKRNESMFHHQSHFYSIKDIQFLLKEAGYKDLHFSQTLFGELDDMDELQLPREGYGEGSFVVVRARKKGEES